MSIYLKYKQNIIHIKKCCPKSLNCSHCAYFRDLIYKEQRKIMAKTDSLLWVVSKIDEKKVNFQIYIL